MLQLLGFKGNKESKHSVVKRKIALQAILPIGLTSKKQVDPMEDSQQIFLFSGVLTSATPVGPVDTMFARLRTAMSIQLVEYSTTPCEGSVLAPPPRRHCLDLPRCQTGESKVASKVSADTEACHHIKKILS
jgi:hypothetical protein